MKYRIEAQTRRRIRIRIRYGRLTKDEADILQYAFSGIPGIRKITIYRETGCCALEYDCPLEDVLKRLDRFRFENVNMLVSEEKARIGSEEVRNRKLDSELKRRLRLRIAVETVADIVMPMPVQVGYHIWQFISLKNL